MSKAVSKSKTRDAEATRQAILDAAEVEFAQAGLMGARTENIAAQTGVTRAMIHYYYDSKEKLYQAVIERSCATRVQKLQNVDLFDEDVERALESYIRNFIADSMERPNMCAIMLFESVQNQGQYYKEIAFATVYQPLCTILERGMVTGVFREVDTMQTAINIVGMCVFYICARNNLRHLFPPGTDLLAPDMAAAHIEQTVALMLHGVKKSNA